MNYGLCKQNEGYYYVILDKEIGLYCNIRRLEKSYYGYTIHYYGYRKINEHF